MAEKDDFKNNMDNVSGLEKIIHTSRDSSTNKKKEAYEDLKKRVDKFYNGMIASAKINDPNFIYQSIEEMKGNMAEDTNDYLESNLNPIVDQMETSELEKIAEAAQLVKIGGKDYETRLGEVKNYEARVEALEKEYNKAKMIADSIKAGKEVPEQVLREIAVKGVETKEKDIKDSPEVKNRSEERKSNYFNLVKLAARDGYLSDKSKDEILKAGADAFEKEMKEKYDKEKSSLGNAPDYAFVRDGLKKLGADNLSETRNIIYAALR